jgi:hypothetical protein
MWQQPRRTLWLKARNIWYFVTPTLVPYHEVTADTRIRLWPDGGVTVEGSPPRPLAFQIAYSASYSFVLAAALVGIYQRRALLWRDGILWSIFLTMLTVHAVYFPSTRYGAPVSFVWFVYAAIAIAGNEHDNRIETI